MDRFNQASRAMRREVRLTREGGATPRRANAHLLPTLLDRLRDDAPQRLTEAPSEYTVTRSQMRDIVQRDLAFLLNTTSMEDLIDRKRHPHAASSTVNFGVPPLAGARCTHTREKHVQVLAKLTRNADREGTEAVMNGEKGGASPTAGTQARSAYRRFCNHAEQTICTLPHTECTYGRTNLYRME